MFYERGCYKHINLIEQGYDHIFAMLQNVLLLYIVAIHSLRLSMINDFIVWEYISKLAI